MAWRELDITTDGRGTIWTARDAADRPRYLVTTGARADAEEPREAIAQGHWTRAAAVREWWALHGRHEATP
jgi:hypothetical protein